AAGEEADAVGELLAIEEGVGLAVVEADAGPLGLLRGVHRGAPCLRARTLYPLPRGEARLMMGARARRRAGAVLHLIPCERRGFRCWSAAADSGPPGPGEGRLHERGQGSVRGRRVGADAGVPWGGGVPCR